MKIDLYCMIGTKKSKNIDIKAYEIYWKKLPLNNLSLYLKLQWEIKRFIDIIGAFIALVILFPLLIVLTVLIRIDSPGNVIFTQTRWGMGGKKFRVYKFRSMRTDMCDKSGMFQTMKGDQRITTVGAFLRKTNLDELPQLLNVLKGDMSLVGPRCHPVGMLASGKLYEDVVPVYHARHFVRPGITGLAQIRGLRGPTVSVAKARARIFSDIYYVNNFSLWLDFKIIIKTVQNEIFGGTGF